MKQLNKKEVNLPGTWQLQPPKPSLQWHWPSKHTPFEQAVPSLSQSSKRNEMNDRSLITILLIAKIAIGILTCTL